MIPLINYLFQATMLRGVESPVSWKTNLVAFYA